MSKNMSEYDSLRSEIISMEEQQRNVWIYMYVLFITLFVLGLELSYQLFLVTYVILIPFQVVINRYGWSISKMSTYIRLFYEKDESNLNWESMHVFYGYKGYYKKFNGSITGKIRYTGASQLGFLASVFYIISVMYDRYSESMYNLNAIDILFILGSICLFFITFILNKEYNKNYVEELEIVIQQYQDSLKNN